jgi:serine/threonine-protein kinase RsbW
MRARLPAEPSALDGLHALLGRVWAEHPGVGATDRAAVALALSELVTNAVEHAGATAVWLDVQVDVDVLPGRVRALVEDDGGPAPDVVASELVTDDPLAESGRGVAIARAMADLQLERRGGRNRWSVTRVLDGP